jgi:hypothetical protein
MKKVYEVIIYIFCPSFYWYLIKMKIPFLKKNGYKYHFRHFFHFLLFFF